MRWHDLVAGLEASGPTSSTGATGRRDRGDHPRQPPGRARCLLRVHPRARGPTATTTRRRRWRGCRALLVERPLPLAVRPGPGAQRAGRTGPGRGRRSTATRRRRCACSASPARTARRPPPTCSRRSRAAGDRAGVDRHHRRARRRGGRSRLGHTTPEASDLQELLGAHARRRRDHGRDGGVVARARPAPRRRCAVRRGLLHQPQPRAPRLPRHPRRVLRGEGAAVRSPRARRRRR